VSVASAQDYCSAGVTKTERQGKKNDRNGMGGEAEERGGESAMDYY